MRALVTGATGFVGGRLTAALLERGAEVSCLVRDSGRAGELVERGAEVYEGDVLEAETLAPALEGAHAAYYLVHGMGRGSSGDFAERERQAALNFATAARAAGVERTVYLGGLGRQPRSAHLRSRNETGRLLGAEGPALTYFRAAMVVGSGSASYETLRHLVTRLPVMIAPSWLQTKTQPIDIDDVVAYLAQAPEVEAAAGREVEIGGPDVLSYGEMLDRMAVALGKRPRPTLPVPVLSPRLSSLWIGLVTPVDSGVARPLVEGLSTETVVDDPSGASLFDVAPRGIDEALRKALAEEDDPLAAAVP
jgi:uncharacterized protein YbjT (DUF2867 family)